MIYALTLHLLISLTLVSCVTSKELKKETFFKKLGYTLNKSDHAADAFATQFIDRDGNTIFISRLYSDLDSAQAQRFFNSRKNYIQSLFQNDEDPYFSKTNRIDSCIQELNLEGKTTEATDWNTLAFDLPATSSFAFGQCNSRLEDKRGLVTYIYCKKTRAGLEIKQFIPKDREGIPSLSKESLCEIF